MHFLIIGNGFDIEHGLPTQYPQFLEYCQHCGEENSFPLSTELEEEFFAIIKNNIWLKYFTKFICWGLPNTWIDLEKEISEIINRIEIASFRFNRIENSKIKFFLPDKCNTDKIREFISSFAQYDEEKDEYTIIGNYIEDENDFISYIYSEMKCFIRAFEIYCLGVNNKEPDKMVAFSELGERFKDIMKTKKVYSELLNQRNQAPSSGEINGLYQAANKKYNDLLKKIRTIDFLSASIYDCVLSFNYTNTYQRLYGTDDTKYCYIHGKAQEIKNRTNLILGIDDNLEGNQISENFKCVKFKKYYQRILHKTGAEYKDWISTDNNTGTIYVHIVGHSLDRTDYEVLYEFFHRDNFKIIIYYYSNQDFEDKIQKVIRLLSWKGDNGRDELIRRVHGSNWNIKFVDQYDKEEGLFIGRKRS